MTGGENGGGASRTTDPAAGSSSATDVSLREHLLAIRFGDLRQIFTLFGAICAFVAFAWTQIQRRLEILNHENERLLAQQEKTVSHDTYQANEQQRNKESDELETWRKEVDRDRTQSVSRDELKRETKGDSRARVSTSTAIIGSIAATIAASFIFINYKAAHSHPATTVPIVVTVQIPTATP